MRALLRERSRDEHVATEAAFENYDLNEEEGLAGSLYAHALAMGQLVPSLAGAFRYQEEAARLMRLALEGLSALAIPAPIRAGESPKLNALGVAYVILGSRLGARVIARRFDPAAPERLRRARAYFVDDASASAWSELRNELEEERPDGEQEDILHAARASFQIFEAAARSCRAGRESLYLV